ncbi:cistern family PEP-CTERM protein [Floridanema aerugineum]|uniref:Cistern family PEP-CTERM protein n=1 Tax=Floridaenema aerugineum BLCC-F46 TaxID=3153654 RepID=A0ABV4X6G6_9CYAN
MLKHFPKLVLGLSALATVEILSLAIAPIASAFTISGNNIDGLTNTDIGKAFEIDFNGSVNETGVSGLTSSAIFTFQGFSRSGSDTNALFDIILKNTSSGGILSRVSAIGFNTDKTELSGSTSALAPSNTALFSGANVNGSFPNGFGNIDICFTNGNTCQGGQNGGVSNSTSLPGVYQQGSFTASVALQGSVNSIAMSNFGVRYQSISGNGFNGASGTGRATTVRVYNPNPTPETRRVPEPGTTLALGAVALSALKLRKRNSVAQA